MKVSRELATPLTIGVFAIMAVTGLLMFFHLDTNLNKAAHEWLGWAMIAGAGAHVAANWLGFRRYFMSSNVARGVFAASVLVLGGSFLAPPGGGAARKSPPTLAIEAIVGAPVASLAPLAGRPVEQLVADLGKAGIVVHGGEATLRSAVGDDRGLQRRAMRAIFAGK